MTIQELLKYTVDHKASDLHLSTGLPPIVRIDGDLSAIPDQPKLEESTILAMLKEVMLADRYEKISTELEMDLSLDLQDIARFRVNVFHEWQGVAVAFRAIPFKTPTLDELNLPPLMKQLCDLPNGLVLMTGPTGCGKSTTLAAMIDYINHSRPEHILTLEDPVEFLYRSDKCLIQQREVHRHTESFGHALRSALREDPDVILVGEMRDLETIRLALTAAETGHLVFATLHTTSAARSINRIIDVFPAGEKPLVRSMLSESLQAIVSQILVKRKGGGRIAVQESMLCTPAIRNLIREDKVPQIYSTIQTQRKLGMRTLEQHLMELVQSGAIEKSMADSLGVIGNV